MSVLPRSRYLVHPSLQFHDAGVEVAFAIGESGPAVRQLFFNLMQVCRYGLPQDVALKGVTLLPAKILGIDKTTGTSAHASATTSTATITHKTLEHL